LPLLEKLAQSGKKDLVLIAEDVEGEAMGTLILNRLKGVFNTVAIKAPAFGDRRKDILNDIAILTGAEVITEDRGMTFENVDLDVVGTARKVIVDKDNTTIIEGGARVSEVDGRIKQINDQIKLAASEYDKEHLEKRRAALSGKVAVIKVGGATETEIEEKKFRVDDAVAAVKAALSDGIVPGGGVTLVNLGNTINIDVLTLTKDNKQTKISLSKLTGRAEFTEQAGKELLAQAMLQPFLQILENAGLNSQAHLSEVLKADQGLGIDVNDPEVGLVNLKDKGVIDPARVTKEAIQNAVSIAGTSMTMGALVVEVPKEDKADPAAAMGGGMMGM
jgi:chaperonin GroEL